MELSSHFKSCPCVFPLNRTSQKERKEGQNKEERRRYMREEGWESESTGSFTINPSHHHHHLTLTTLYTPTCALLLMNSNIEKHVVTSSRCACTLSNQHCLLRKCKVNGWKDWSGTSVLASNCSQYGWSRFKIWLPWAPSTSLSWWWENKWLRL